MENHFNLGDLQYGNPSFDRGHKFSPGTSCSYFEVLEYAGPHGSMFHSSSGALDDSSLEQWLSNDITSRGGNEGTPTGTPTGTFTGGLRLLFGNCLFDAENNYRILPFKEDKFNTVSKHFQLPPQFLPSMASSLSRSFKFSCLDSTTSTFNPTTCFVFKIALHGIGQYHIGISHSPHNNLTYALLLFRPRFESTPIYDSLIQNLIANPSLATHPLYLPILITEFSIQSSAFRIDSADEELNKFERATGQHGWSDISMGDPLKLDFPSTTQQLNFTSRWLGMEIWRSKANLLVLENVASGIDLPSLSESHRSNVRDLKEEGMKLKELIAYHTNTCHNLILRAEFEEKRLQTQIAVVYQSMAQKDSKVNIELAETTTVIARESKKDGSAMKAIAVLTMFFLPSTFLAALFAMPLFNWDGGGLPIIKDGFKYYWAIAIPLTLLVLLIWAASILLPWEQWKLRRENRKGDVEAAGGERKKDD